MSSKDESSNAPKAKILTSQELLMEFLANNPDISKLTVVTKSGAEISASFNGTVSASGDETVFKSLDALKSLNGDSLTTHAPVSQSTVSLDYAKSAGDMFTSKDWQVDYAQKHVDVKYDNCFSESASENQNPPSLSSSSALPPKKRPGPSGKTDWNGMFASQLQPLIDAAQLVQPEPVGEDAKRNDIARCQKQPDSKSQSKQSKRKPRKIIPEVKDFVDEYSPNDILFGRGGRSNHHPGNKLYRDVVTERQPYYRNCDKHEKTKVAQNIVDLIQIEHKGRFLELDKDTNRWYVVPNIVARRKVGQALRENNTEEARAAKREKYGPKSKKSSKGSVGSVDSSTVELSPPPIVSTGI